MRSEVTLRAGTEADAEGCAGVFNDWVDATAWMPRVHAPEAVVRHYREHVLATCEVTVAEAGGAVAGFLALDVEGWVAGLYLAPAVRGRGVGAALLDRAKAQRSGGLTLWTFVANEGARRFYARQGFVEVGRSEGENEEGLPDLLFRWRETG
jgi:GNAT superfamily N-acetyltransferase